MENRPVSEPFKAILPPAASPQLRKQAFRNSHNVWFDSLAETIATLGLPDEFSRRGGREKKLGAGVPFHTHHP